MNQQQVTVFSKPGCQPCNMTKRMLNQRNVEYTEVDISTNEFALQLVQKLGFLEAPVVLVSDSKDTISSILADEAKMSELLQNPKATIVDSWSGLRPDKITHFFPQAPAKVPFGTSVGASHAAPSIGGLN